MNSILYDPYNLLREAIAAVSFVSPRVTFNPPLKNLALTGNCVRNTKLAGV